MIRALRGLQALQEPLERQAQCQDLQVRQVILVQQDQQVTLVQQDLLVLQEIQVLLVQQDQRVQLEPLVLPVQLVRQALMQLRCQGYLC